MKGRPTPPGAATFRLPLLVFLFFWSGCAALMYEVIWFQMLPLVLGSSAVSLAVLLGAFMGGMCLGSLFLPAYLDARRHPMRWYALLELGIGASGLALLWGLPLVNIVYAAVGGSVLVRGALAVICLLPPTVMMGATLPLVARWLQASPSVASRMGFLYGSNVAGAMLGSLAAGFYLLRVYDAAVATYVAALLNVGVAALAWRVGSQALPASVAPPARLATDRAGRARVVYVAIAISGVTALSAQVIWTRLLALAFGATVYVFSLILAVFLFGLGLGSAAGAALARAPVNPRAALGWCQWLLTAAIGWAAFLLTRSLPFWPIDPALTSDPSVNLQLDLFRAALVVLPGSILWGASFPLALAAASTGEDAAPMVGRVYAANTLGAVVGAVTTGWLVASSSSQTVQQGLIVLSAASALVLLVPLAMARRSPSRARVTTPSSMAAAVAAAVWIAWTVAPVPGLLVAYGRYSATWAGLTTILYTGEGLTGSVAVSRSTDGVLTYHSAGKVQASSLPEDMRLQRMLGHFSHLIPRQPKRVLVIGYGAGVTAGAIAIAPSVDHTTIVEIEPLVAASVAPYFADVNDGVVGNKRVTVRIDDARHFLLTTSETFDVITSDLVDPWVKGTAALFTREFFELAKRRLNPGGIVTMFVQLYQSTPDSVKSEIATFTQVFPNTVVWGNTHEGQGYDLVLTAQVEPMRIDVGALQAKLENAAYAPVAQSLREIGIESAADLLSTYAGSAADLAPWLQGAVINRDRNLRLQYLAGMGLGLRQNAAIYTDMLRHARFPPALFTGSAAAVQGVRERIGSRLTAQGSR